MKERPIIFSGESVRLILDGRKTQTRRVIKPQPLITYDINDELIRVEFLNDQNKRWSFAEADPRFAERGLHGRGRWEDLLANEICGLWSQGLRGLVCVVGRPNQKGVSNCFFVPRRTESHEVGASTSLHGLSRNASIPIGPSETSQRQWQRLCPDESLLGNSNRELAGSQSSCEALDKRNVQVHARGTRAYSLGDKEGTLQSEACGTNARLFARLNLRDAPYREGLTLWIRETWADNIPPSGTIYRADGEAHNGFPEKWKPAIFMPRSYSRIQLEITKIRVERIQQISEQDALAEGVMLVKCPHEFERHEPFAGTVHIRRFSWLWDSLNRARGFGWHANPFVWVLEFKRVEQ